VRQADVDRAEGTVGSSFGPLVGVLDVCRAKGDELTRFADVLEVLPDALPLPPAVLGALRPDLDESLHDVNEWRENLDDSSQDLKDSSPDLRDSSQDRKPRPQEQNTTAAPRLQAHARRSRALEAFVQGLPSSGRQRLPFS
jgi:hypothetical protein